MKLGVRIPLLFGIIVLTTSVLITFMMARTSRLIFTDTIHSAMRVETDINEDLLSSKLVAQLDVIAEIATRIRVRSMDWSQVQPTLVPDVSRIGALDLAMATPSGSSHYVLDNTIVEVGDRDYFKKAMAGQKNVEMVFSRISGTLVALFCVPIYRDDTPGAPVIGVLIARKDGQSALTNMVNELESSMETGKYMVINNSGTFIAHSNTEWVKEQLNPIQKAETDSSFKSMSEMTTAALRDKDGFSSYTYNGVSYLDYYTTVDGFPWMIINSVEMSEINAKINKIRFSSVGFSLVLIFTGLVIAFFVGRSIAKPIANIALTLKDIAEGEGDLTHAIKINSKDELGDLALYFNETLEKLKRWLSIYGRKRIRWK